MRKLISILSLLILVYIAANIYKNKSSSYYNNRGVELYEKGDYDTAINYYKKSLAILPDNYLTHSNLANAYKTGNYENAAIAEYIKCIQLNPTSHRPHKSLAEIYLNKGMHLDAVKHLKKGLELAPQDKDINELLSKVTFSAANNYISKAVTEFTSGNRKYAYDLLNDSIALNKESAHPHYLLAYFYYAERKFDKAISELEKTLKLDPQFQSARKLLGDIYFDTGHYPLAIDQYKNALSLNNNDYILYNNIAIAFVQLERYQEALPFIKRALELAPGNANILYGLASIYRDNNMLDLALSEYNKLTDYPNVHNNIAGIYLAQGKKKEAVSEYYKQIQYCNRKLSTNPSDALILNDLANAYIGTEQYNNAQAAINAAINIHPNYKQSYITLANIQKKLNKNTLAAETLKKAEQLSEAPKLKIISRDISSMISAPIINAPAFTDLDKVYLKNGRVFEGVIKNKNAEKIILEIKIGGSTGDMILYADTIARVIEGKKKK